MIEKRQKTVTVYAVEEKEFDRQEEAVEEELRRALGGYLKGARASILVADLASALGEPAVRHALQEIIVALANGGGKNLRGL